MARRKRDQGTSTNFFNGGGPNGIIDHHCMSAPGKLSSDSPYPVSTTPNTGRLLPSRSHTARTRSLLRRDPRSRGLLMPGIKRDGPTDGVSAPSSSDEDGGEKSATFRLQNSHCVFLGTLRLQNSYCVLYYQVARLF